MKIPPHFPDLAGNNNNHSVGWLNVTFSNGSWIQIGWLGGCLGNGTTSLCDTNSIGLYDESSNAVTGAYILGNDGSLSYSATDIYRIEYYISTQCWEVFDGYNNLLRSLCGTFPSSGGPAAGSEVYNGATTSTAVEMPYTYYGSSNPNSNSGLRIKGANGYVAWTTTLSTGSTNTYDERNCPSPSYCSRTPAYDISDIASGNYYFEAFGNT